MTSEYDGNDTTTTTAAIIYLTLVDNINRLTTTKTNNAVIDVSHINTTTATTTIDVM